MTDQSQTDSRAQGTDRLELRLERWFATELARAEVDVKNGLLASTKSGHVQRGPTGRRTALAGLLVSTTVAILLIVALVGGFLGAGLTPSPSGRGSTPSSVIGILMGPNGIPTSIDGEPVLTVQEGLARAAQSTDATTFLVGGWLDDAKALCPFNAAPSADPALIDVGLCGRQPALIGSAPYDINGQPMIDQNELFMWTVFLDGASPPEPRPDRPVGQPEELNLAVVLRVHTHDASAAVCSTEVRFRCDQAVVVDAVLWRATVGPVPAPSPSSGPYADGIPQTFDGRPVLRGKAAASFAAATTDDTSFIVGGWLATVIEFCALEPYPPQAPDRLLTDQCDQTVLNDSPAPGQPRGFVVRSIPGGPSLPPQGPAILRVHTHDPLAASCQPADAAACEQAIVLEAVLWDGPVYGADGLPTWLSGQPSLTVAQAIAHLAAPADATDSTPFLVRGWFDLVPVPCPSVLEPSGAAGLLPYSCPPMFIGPAPIPPTQFGATGDDISLVFPSGVDPPANGPVVLEVHGHDAAAASCDPSIRAACAAAVVVDRVVWVGP